jgi:hypothetical protein
MFTRRSLIASASRRATTQRMLSQQGPNLSGTPGAATAANAGAAVDSQAKEAARGNPQMLLALGVGAATALWIASVLCREKTSDDRLSYQQQQYPTRVDPPRSDLELRGKPGQEQSKSGRAW